MLSEAEFSGEYRFKEFIMNNTLKTVLAASALLALAACASVNGPVYYDGYYDGYYGPLYDGYWGDDNFFYYSGGPGQPFVADRGNHFQRGAVAGFNSFHHAHMGPHIGHPHEIAHR
jgi:hypothetical protein